MASSTSFALTRAFSDDTLAIAEVLYDAFDQFARDAFFGARTEDDLPKLAEKYSKIMSSDSADIWLKVTDTVTGKVVAASNWKLYNAPESAQPRVRDEPAPWLSDEERERQRLLIEPMNAARVRANPGPFMYLHILATHSRYRRRGLGAMMMQWGVDVADSLFLPGFIEASPEGNFLYKRFGFYDDEEIRRDDELLGRKGEIMGMTMKRDARSTPIAVVKS